MIHRRTFLAMVAAARARAADFPSRPAKVVKLFRSPDGHPNGLETAQEGLGAVSSRMQEELERFKAFAECGQATGTSIDNLPYQAFP